MEFQPGEAELISQTDSLEYTKALLTVTSRKLTGIRENLEENPRTDNQNIRNDWRWQSGFIAGLKWVLKRPEEARNYIEFNDK